MVDSLFGEIDDVDEGERLVLDIEREYGDGERGVATVEADRVAAYGNVPVASEESGNRVGSLAETDDGGTLGLYEENPTGLGRRQATVRGVTRTDRGDLDPVSIGRDRGSGEFTPDNTVPAPESPSDRDPDDGEFTTPDPRPITDIGRQESDGLFDLF